VPIGPGFYPRIVLGVTALFALLLVAAEWRGRRKPRPQGRSIDYRLVAVMFLVFGVYCGALPYLGFRVATFAYVAATNALLDPPRDARGWGRAVLVGLLTTLGTYYVFEHYLTVLLPRGRWTDF
jgi:hypothetical protein